MGARAGVALQCSCTLRDSQAAKEVALAHRAEGTHARRSGQGREVDVRAQVGFARPIEDIGAAMAAPMAITPMSLSGIARRIA